MKTPKSLRRLLCSCDGGYTCEGKCTTCGKTAELTSLTEAQLYGVIRRLERKVEGLVRKRSDSKPRHSLTDELSDCGRKP